MTIREQILSLNDRPRTPIVMPEWGGITVYAAPLTSARQIAYAAALKDADSSERAALLVSFGAEDEAGELIFSREDVAALAAKNFQAINRLTAAITDATPSNNETKKNS